MQQFITAETVLAELTGVLAEALRIEPGRISPQSSIVDDLGAESLDFLDINYRMEQIFGIRIARHFFLEHAEEMFGEGTVIDDDGLLTERAIPLFERRYGHKPERLVAGMDMDEVPMLITVQSMVDGIMSILETLPASCPCGATAWTCDGKIVTCGQCSQKAAYTNGDELTKQWLTQVDSGSGLLSGNTS
ncbi:MAG: hypothetical protein DRJ65_02845 [Acidobacteria bacterium]|nr:MAG: hypothetical protein DRJ65_02845 [Acidobacteriota bacterium]